MPEPMILDGHCHVASTDFIPMRFVEDVVANIHRRMDAEGMAPPTRRLVDMYRAQNQDHNADTLVRDMDAAGIERAVLMAPDFSRRLPCQLTMEEVSKRHHEIQLRHPGRFWVYTGVDPRDGVAGVHAFERRVERYGIAGMKLYPPCGYSPSADELYPYYEVCAARGLPVLVHTGPTAASLDFEPAHPLHVDKAARDFPSIDFVLGHGGVTHVDVSAYLAAYRRNVYIDIAGIAGARVIGGWVNHLARVFRMDINHKIIFGTDWPINRISGGTKRLIDQMFDGAGMLAGISRTERSLILRENLLRVLPASEQGRIRAPMEATDPKDRENSPTSAEASP